MTIVWIISPVEVSMATILPLPRCKFVTWRYRRWFFSMRRSGATMFPALSDPWSVDDESCSWAGSVDDSEKPIHFLQRREEVFLLVVWSIEILLIVSPKNRYNEVFVEEVDDDDDWGDTIGANTWSYCSCSCDGIVAVGEVVSVNGQVVVVVVVVVPCLFVTFPSTLHTPRSPVSTGRCPQLHRQSSCSRPQGQFSSWHVPRSQQRLLFPHVLRLLTLCWMIFFFINELAEATTSGPSQTIYGSCVCTATLFRQTHRRAW